MERVLALAGDRCNLPFSAEELDGSNYTHEAKRLARFQIGRTYRQVLSRCESSLLPGSAAATFALQTRRPGVVPAWECDDR